MAVTKSLKTVSLSIEIQKGTDKAGDPIYSQKTFANVKSDAASQDIYDVAEAIKAVLDVKTRDTFINESSNLINA